MKKLEKNLDVLVKISDERAAKGDLVGAISVLLNDCLYSKRYCIVYKKLGDLYVKSGDCAYALFNYLKYIELCPKNMRPEAYQSAGIACIKSGRDKLALDFFNEQLLASKGGECFYSDEVADFLSCIEEKEKKPKFKVIDKTGAEELFENGLKAFYFDNYDLAIEYFSKIPKESKFYEKALFDLALSYSAIEENEKAIKKMDEYFKNYSPTVSQYCTCINMLSFLATKGEVSQKKVTNYFNKLYKVKIKDNSDYFEIAQLIVSNTEDYDRVLFYINRYLENDPFDDEALFIKGMSLLLSGKTDGGIASIKKAYLLTHNCKYKYVLEKQREIENENSGDYGEIVYYPHILLQDYVDLINGYIDGCLNVNGITESDLLDLIKYAKIINLDEFWRLVIGLLRKGEKKFFNEAFADVLLCDNVNVDVKSCIIEELVLKGFEGERGILFTDFYSRIHLFSSAYFKTQFFKEAYSYTCGRFPVMINKAFIEQAKVFEENFCESGINCTKEELAGAAFYYCNEFGDKCDTNFFKNLKTSKRKSKQLAKEIMKIN